MTRSLLGLTGALALFAATPAAATIIIDTGAGVIMPEENVLFTNDPPDGLLILGITNQSDTLIRFFGGETLVGNGGQARVEAADDLVSTSFAFDGLGGQFLGINPLNPNVVFNQAEFRVFVGQGTATQLTVTAFDTGGTQFQQTFAIPSNGFFYLNAIDGQQIDRFSLAANGSFEDLRQVRLGGIAVIPEPASWAMMIVGFGAAGSLLRRRRTSAVA